MKTCGWCESTSEIFKAMQNGKLEISLALNIERATLDISTETMDRIGICIDYCPGCGVKLVP